ncbi:MAG TPA: tetratricopeptide repeat protein [Thermomicrobiales bacterium]|nr:tetratricopeptide repeat protein [Thermomicrobiales bacterium]
MFLRTLALAEARSAEEAWREAAPLWEQVVAANPVEGRFWSRLGEARFNAKDERAAIDAYERVLDLRDGFPAETAYRIGLCYARLNEGDRAIEWLERAVAMGYRHLEKARDDPDLAPLRNDRRFRELFGMVKTAGDSRDEGWRDDLRFLAREVKRRAFMPFRESPEVRFDDAVEALNRAIPGLRDAQILVEMAKLLRLLGDAHAYVAAPDERPDLKRSIPLRLFLFEEGLHVVAAEPAYESVLGGEVLAFGESASQDAIDAVNQLIGADNENGQWPRYIATLTLVQTPILQALGVIPEPERVALTVRRPNGEVVTETIEADQQWSRSEMRNALPCPEGWRFFPETLETPVPLYLKNAGASYWFEYLPDARVVYWQFNRVRDDAVEPLARFSERIFAFIDDHPVDKLVLDLRWNSGGNTFLELPLLHGLIANRKINRRGRLFVIIGRKTFSAAQNGATMIDRHTEAIFVGEPTGSSPTFVGESVEFQLPYSKLLANVSDLLWQTGWPMDYRTWIAPTIYTPPTFADFRANRDPALEAILTLREHLPGW